MGALALAAAGACAAATLFAALDAAEATPERSPAGAATVAAGLDPTPAPEAAAGSGGVWDPALQRFRDPTGEELARMSGGALRPRAERPRVELRPDGSMVLRVPEEGFGATWGHLRPDGTAQMRCAHSGSAEEAPAGHPISTHEEE